MNSELSNVIGDADQQSFPAMMAAVQAFHHKHRFRERVTAYRDGDQ